jgi:hypothetical protein
MLELNWITVASQKVLEQSAEALSGGVLVYFKMVKILTGCSIPLEEIAIFVLDGALRSHTHLYDW